MRKPCLNCSKVTTGLLTPLEMTDWQANIRTQGRLTLCGSRGRSSRKGLGQPLRCTSSNLPKGAFRGERTVDAGIPSVIGSEHAASQPQEKYITLHKRVCQLASRPSASLSSGTEMHGKEENCCMPAPICAKPEITWNILALS